MYKNCTLYIGGDMFISLIWWDLLFLGFYNLYLNRLKNIYINSLYDWFNFVSFCENKYFFLEIKFFIFFFFILSIELFSFYPQYQHTDLIMHDIFYLQSLEKKTINPQLNFNILY